MRQLLLLSGVLATGIMLLPNCTMDQLAALQGPSNHAFSPSFEAQAVLSGWTGHENVTVIVVYNVDYGKLQALSSQILLRVRGVVDVVTRDLTGSRATIEVFSETGTQEVIDDLSPEEMGLDFQITGMAGNRVEIHFGD